MLYRIARFLIYLYFIIFYRVETVGKENIPAKGPLLLYANHPSGMDMFLIACFFKRKIHYMAKVEIFKNPVIAFLLRRVGAFPISRGKGDVGSVKTVYKFLEKGRVVGVFPEGTRTPKKDPTRRKAGAAMLAYHSRATILPVGVEWNNKKFSTLRIVFGEPFKMLPKEDGGHIAKEELQNATQEIMDKIYKLIGQ